MLHVTSKIIKPKKAQSLEIPTIKKIQAAQIQRTGSSFIFYELTRRVSRGKTPTPNIHGIFSGEGMGRLGDWRR